MHKPGIRLKSAACDTEVIVVRAGDGVITCGGAPMSAERTEAPAALSPEHASGSLMGKRYVSSDGRYELLCVKPGQGSLSASGAALVAKEAKPLPASD